MHGHVGVKEGRLMASSEVMEAQLGKLQTRSLLKLRCNRPRIAQSSEVHVATEARKHQGALGQLDEREVNRDAVRHTRNEAKVLVPLCEQQRDECIINLNDAFVARPLGLLEP